MYRLLRRVVDVEPGEVRAMLLACLYFFCIFTSYFILRPIRDEMAVASGARSLPWLFAGTLTGMAIVNPLYAALVVRFPVKRFITITYQFFALNLVLFYLAWRSGGATEWTGRAFFVWTSVFNLFVLSVFWSLMADTFRSGQAKRLFGFIAVGGTLGSITGTGLTALLVDNVGAANLLLVSAAMLQVAVAIVLFFPSAPRSTRPEDAAAEAADEGRTRERHAIGGSVWAGFLHTIRSPYLAGIALYLTLFLFGSAVLYSAQTEIVGTYFTDREARTQVLAQMEFATQVLTAIVQAFVTGRFMRRFGVAATLGAVPVVSMLGFAALAATSWGMLPVFATFVALSVFRRGTEFSLGRPAREVLYTVVPREDKYKAKSFLDTFVYRLGDQIGIWSYAGLAALGLTLTGGIAWVAVLTSFAFLALAIWLGRRQQERARDAASERAPVDVAGAAPVPAR
jgi:ATP:ADP antiporter, AAA family